MSSTVLLVDAESQVRPIIERHLDPAHWTLIQVSDSEQALQSIKDRTPALIVLNVDIAKGWPLCTQLKRQHAAIPVIVVSFRLGKEVFNNHQKLDTRADAYHRLPEELEMLEISLGYFSSHRSEIDEDSAPRKARRGNRVAVPTGVVQRLEGTVAEQARALEDAKRQIEALEVERDAVAEKNRRQMLELMAVGPSSVLENVGETQALRTRIAVLEAEQLASARREEELRDLRAALNTANAALTNKTAEVDRIAGERGALEVAADNFEQALDEARTSAERTRQMLEAQVLSLRAEKAQIAQRVSELEESNRYQRDLSPTGESLEAAREAARREASDAADQLAEASVQLSSLANQLTQAYQLRSQIEKEKRAAEDRVGQLEQQVAILSERVAQATSAARSESNDERIEELQHALADKSAEAEQHLTDKKSIEQALSTSRRLMREYATDAARKAEELSHASERTKELEQLLHGFAATKAELMGALEFEKSLVESLEKELATARQTAVPTSEIDALRAKIGEVEAKAAADKEAARIAAADDLDTLRIVAQSELDDARNQAQAALDKLRAEGQAAIEALRHELATAQAEAAQAAALADAEQAAHAQSQAERERVLASHAVEREALAAHVAAVHTRFEALVVYARALESRLVDAEERRGTLEARLEELLGEVRAQALSGEIPPPMELPSVPVVKDSGSST